MEGKENPESNLRKAARVTKNILKSPFKRRILLIAIAIAAVIILCGAAYESLVDAFSDNVSEYVQGNPVQYNTDDNSIVISDETIDGLIKVIEDMGIDLDDMELTRDDIAKLYAAEVVSSEINRGVPEEAGKYYGRVYIKRLNPDTGELEMLSYEPSLEAFEQMSASEILNYYSMDGDKICIASTNTTTDEQGNTTSTVSINKLSYKDNISQYTVPIEFLLDLCLISQNPGFVLALADKIINETEIVIQVLQNKTTIQTDTTYTYTTETETSTRKNVYDFEGNYLSSSTTTSEPTKSGPTSSTTTQIQTNVRSSIKIQSVKSWIMEVVYTYNRVDTTDVQTPDPELIEDEEKPAHQYAYSNRETNSDGSYTDIYTSTISRKIDQSRTYKITTTSEMYQSGVSEGVKDRVDEFIEMLRTPYSIPSSGLKKAAIDNLENGAEMLFQMLRNGQRTQSLEQLMRYILGQATGNEYGVSEFNIEDTYSISQLNQVVAGSSIGKEFTKSWENNALRKYMNGETGYIGHYVTNYITQDNTKFVCYTDKNNTRNYGFGVCHYTGGVAGGQSNNHVEKYANLGIDITAPEYNQIDVSTMDVDIVMTIFNQEYQEMRAEVLDRKEKYAPNAPDLTEQQIICLTDMRYQGSINWPTFYEIYATQNIESIKSYILNQSSDTRGEARWKAYSEGIYITPENEVLDPDKYGTGSILDVAKQVWLEIINRFTTYGGLGAVPPSKNKTQIDCSGYVTWVLYECGYTDFDWQVNTEKFYNTNWNQKYGWTEIFVGSGENAIDLLQPGDIFVRYGEGTHHVLIVERIENGRLYAYDCGSAKNWLNSGGNSVNKTYFLDEVGSGKIIRIQ